MFPCRAQAGAQLWLTLCPNGEGMKGRCILLSFEIGSNSTEINGAPQHKMDVKEEPGPEVIN